MAGLIAIFVKAVTTAIALAAIGSLLKFVRLLKLHRGKLAELQKKGLVCSFAHFLNFTTDR